MNKGAVFCIIDGLSDESITAKDLTCLGTRAEKGAYGFFDTVPPGFEVESYPCIAGLLGVEAADLPPLARAYVEALGAGIAVAEDDLVLRGSWFTLAEDDTLGGPAPAPLEPPSLPDGCEYYSLGGYKALLLLRGCAHLLPRIQTFPPYACAGQKLSSLLPAGEPLLIELIRLSRSQRRVLLPWGQSAPCKLPLSAYGGAAIGAAPVFGGLAQAMGFDFYSQPGFTGDIDTDFFGKLRLTLELTRKYPLVILHINAADEAAHRCDYWQKRLILRLIDSIVLKPLLKEELPLLVCGDHGASPITGRHIGGEQAFILSGTALRGDLGLLPATSALKLLLKGKF